MNNKPTEQLIDQYFDCARKIKCPPTMKKNLYQQVSSEKKSWFSARYAMAGLSLVFVTSVIFKISTDNHIQENNLLQAQTDLQIAMHYMNRVSFKSLSSVNNKGIRPGLIVPMAKSVASL